MLNPKSLVTEVGIFAIGLGVLLLIAVIGIVNTLDASAPPIFGMARRTGLGLVIGTAAVLNILAGVFLLMKRKPAGIAACMLASLTILLAYFMIMIGSGVGIRFNLLTIIIMAIPVTLILRGCKALAEIE